MCVACVPELSSTKQCRASTDDVYTLHTAITPSHLCSAFCSGIGSARVYALKRACSIRAHNNRAPPAPPLAAHASCNNHAASIECARGNCVYEPMHAAPLAPRRRR